MADEILRREANNIVGEENILRFEANKIINSEGQVVATFEGNNIILSDEAATGKVNVGSFVSGPNDHDITFVECKFKPIFVIVRIPFANNDTFSVWWNNFRWNTTSLWELRPAEGTNYFTNLGRTDGETGIQQIHDNGFSFICHAENTRNLQCDFIAVG